jgi:[amino group carrier protein]-lysine/ornithine hydrolase
MNPVDFKDEIGAVALLRRMIEIPSPSGGEQALAAYLVDEMARLGLDSEVDGAGNAVGRGGGADGPLILLLGHLDTVASQIPVREEGTRLYGRGAVDAKGPLATMISAVARLASLDARLVVIGAVEEETPSSRGAHYLLDRYDPDAVLIGEPSGWSNVVLGYKGRIGIHYAVRRPPTHSAGPGEKATEVAVEFWNRLAAHCAESGGNGESGGGLFDRPTVTLGRFAGTMELAELDISCRTPPGFDFPAFDRFLASIAGDARLETDDWMPAVRVERSEPTVRALTQSIRSHGGQPKLKVKTGTSDMNTVAKRWRVPLAAYGPGDSALDHTDVEHIDLDEYRRAIEVLCDALPRLSAELKERRPPAISEAPAAEAAVYTAAEEEELSQRLAALGYLE